MNEESKKMSLEKQLVQIFRDLPAFEQQTLFSFAQFLAQQNTKSVPSVPSQPLDIPRPETESVIAAIKRLSKTYPMLERKLLFNQTSILMTQHVMHGRERKEVIDELEQVFQQHYQQWLITQTAV